MDPLLIVDDEKDNLEALQRLLRNQYAITTTNSPFEALKIVQKSPFNVIVSDQRMPEMTGVELLEKVKNISPQTTRILLTGYTDIESVIGAINRGHIYRYVAKPWDPEELKLTLRQANEAYHLRRELDEKNRALEKTNHDLSKAVADLQLLDRAKARFLSLVSHELNTPLTVLTSFVQLLAERRSKLDGDMAKALASIEGASHRFSEIVAEVLTYVRLEAESKVSLKAFDLPKECGELCRALAPALQKKKLGLKLVSKGKARPLLCDPQKTKVALNKLLEDAIERAPSGSEIQIEVEHTADHIRCGVWRTGEPISPEALEPLEAAATEMHHHRNLGLSLATCKLIVESHGGKVTLDSDAGRGTWVHLVFPNP